MLLENFRIFLLFIVFLSQFGCVKLDSFIVAKSTTPVVQISSTKPLYVSTTSSLGLFTHNYTAITPTDSSVSPAAGANVSGAGVGIGTSLATTNSTPLTPSNVTGLTSISAINENYSVTMTSSEDLSSWTCQIFSNTVLSLCGGNPVNFSASILGNATQLSLQFSSSTGSASSNSLPVYSYKIRQIANTRNANNLNDGISSVYVYNSKIYYSATNNSGQNFRLFQIDPVIQEVRQIFSSSMVNSGRSFTVGTVAGKLIFWGANGSSALKLHSFDGTNIVQISNTTADQTRNDTYYGNVTPITYAGKLYFACRGPSFASNILCRYDGTTLEILTTTAYVHDVEPTDQFFFFIGTKLYFLGNDTGQNTLLSYDTSNSTLNRLNSVNVGSSTFTNIVGPLNGKYYTNADPDFGLVETTDFSSFTKISNSYGSGTDSVNFSSFNVPVGNKIIFNSNNSNGFTKCYTFDGTEIRQLVNNLGPNSHESCSGYVFNGVAYMISTNAQGVNKLFKYDGTTLTQISNTSGNNSVTDTAVPISYIDNKLYFRANNSAGFSKLYMYDGVNVVQLTNTNPTGHDVPQYVTKLGSYLYFMSMNANGSQKFYRLCSTADPGCTD